MKKKELESLFGIEDLDLGSIEVHLDVVAKQELLPRFAVGMCTARIEESAPALRAVLARAAAGEPLSDDDGRRLFRGIYILGGARDSRAFPDLLRLLRRGEAEVAMLLGDMITKHLAQIAAGMFDGDAEAVFEAIADRSIDEYSREALLGAATFLAWIGRIDRERMQRFLRQFYEQRLADDDDMAWVGWLEAIARLGLRNMAPFVHAAWKEGRVPEGLLDREDFETDLRHAEQQPDDEERFAEANLGYIEDVVVALEGTDRLFTTEDDEEDYDSELTGELPPWSLGEPVVNPWRNVGRNDPCPCGSGKKAKKCCLPR
jgi:Protein of unknown function (DUF1186)/SEC-C motif